MRTHKYPKIKNLDWSAIRNTNVRHFMLHAYNEMASAGVEFKLTPNKTVDCDGLRTSGYFDSEDKFLVAGMNKPMRDWLRIILHEYSHFEQWRYGVPAWRNTTYGNGVDALDIFFDWLNGKDTSINKLVKATHRTQACELDCERRAMELIQRFQLPFKPGWYAQQAGAYMYLYPYALIRRRWSRPRCTPYSVPQIIKCMPTTLSGDYTKISAQIVLLFDKYC